ncbi:helix-turn-helix domain-containing protein [Clostridium butyricum]|uniref:helix-turn-helix domain-containing protein n=1 Tax=Clostridium butyricum TaxID=1492 RepID=UPI0004290139|nr:helix-turn-helix domain-containing protein [Clostridium butyricum]MBS5982362.1 MerR family transcriptional regulator [Clostridium butyricum]MDB2153188.1 helix-turn-helix domain-containing protein [Clostridium butyricum]
MENSNRFINISSNNSVELTNRKRGDIPYYTLSQVASLLNENEGQIRYYTNIFDDILKIEIADKQFIYTECDLNKLEFLIKLKNKGMTIKQISDYCDKLSLDTPETFIKESNTASINDFIKIFVDSQSKELNNFKNQLSEQIESCITKQLNIISDKIINEQRKQINTLEKNIFNYVNNFFNEQNSILNSKIDYSDSILKYENLISEKNDIFKNEIDLKIQSFSEELKNNYILSNNNILNEIKKAKDVIYQAYSIENQIAKEEENVGLFKRLFGFK